MQGPCIPLIVLGLLALLIPLAILALILLPPDRSLWLSIVAIPEALQIIIRPGSFASLQWNYFAMFEHVSIRFTSHEYD